MEPGVSVCLPVGCGASCEGVQASGQTLPSLRPRPSVPSKPPKPPPGEAPPRRRRHGTRPARAALRGLGWGPGRSVVEEGGQLPQQLGELGLGQEALADEAQGLRLGERLEVAGRLDGQEAGQLAEGHVEGGGGCGGLVLGAEGGAARPEDDAEARAGGGRSLRRGAPRGEEVVGDVAAGQVAGEAADAARQPAQPPPVAVEEEARGGDVAAQQELTFLSKQEILLAHRRFSELLSKEERDRAFLTRLPPSKMLTLPELRANPFGHRICQVFSTAADGGGNMSFEDFLDMLSVFSDAATPEIKSHYAFRIFDFDDDGTLDMKDLENLVNCLTGEDSRLSPVEMEQLIQNILEESDIDKDGTINLSEFQHIISRSPDFPSSFKIVL